MIELPSVSVVVPAYNCQDTISQLIKSVINQTVRGIEIVIVDDGSADNTATEIQSFKEVVYIYQDNAGPATARNVGAARAKGELVFFTDSDCVAKNDWIEKSLRHFDDPKVAVVSGSYGIANEENFLARCVHQEIIYRHSKLLPRNPKVFGSYNFGIRKKVFHELGGFNTGYRYASGEDNDLSYRVIGAGYRIYFEIDSIVSHYHPSKLVKYLKEQYRHGYWRVRMYRDHPSMAQGDDYTFWKDIIEIPLSFGVIVGFAVALFFPGEFVVFLSTSLLIIFVAIEIFFGILITKSFFCGIYCAFVMFLRSFARMFGFSSGIASLSLPK